jgi:hypothetical protein
VQFLPVCSSFLNPIETVWALFKGHFQKVLIEKMHVNWTKDMLDQEIRETLAMIPPDNHINIALGFKKMYLKYHVDEREGEIN